jgi:hypothetical protein
MRSFMLNENNKDIEDAAYLINHTCLKKLPTIFLEVIKGLSQIVDTFLGRFLIIFLRRFFYKKCIYL